MEVVRKIALDFSRKTMPITVYAKQYDKDTRKIEITPLNNGESYNLESGITARLQMTKPDGTTVINNATISSGKITVTLTGQCLTAYGQAVAEIGIYKNATLLTSQTFFIEVERAAYDEEAPESSDEYAALIDATADANAALITANNAVAAAEAAVAAAEEIVGDVQSLIEEVHYGHAVN